MVGNSDTGQIDSGSMATVVSPQQQYMKRGSRDHFSAAFWSLKCFISVSRAYSLYHTDIDIDLFNSGGLSL